MTAIFRPCRASPAGAEGRARGCRSGRADGGYRGRFCASDPAAVRAWCANMGGGWGFDCSYFTFEQCMATARGLGNSCSPNPNAIVPQRAQVRSRGRYYIDQWGRRVRIR